MELPDLGERLLEAAEHVNAELGNGDGEITSGEMKDVILDVSMHFDSDDNEMQRVWLTLMNVPNLDTFFMESLKEKYPEIWNMRVAKARMDALSQGFSSFVRDWANKETEDIIDQATRVSMTNGSYMGDIDLFFSKHQSAGRNWGNMIRATLVVLWMLTADEDHWEDVTGVEALELWQKATEAANRVLPDHCLLDPRRAYP